MNFYNPYLNRPENASVTKAFELVKKGQTEKAVELIRDAGYEKPEWQVEMIAGFINFMEASNENHQRNSSVRRAPRRRGPANRHRQKLRS
jgi:3,4-dihydroxy-2-butanone 4-phosphate synthase